MWECGLKLSINQLRLLKQVTPYVGVWIETLITSSILLLLRSLLMWECGLKRHEASTINRQTKSLLMWECGLKQHRTCRNKAVLSSLLMWECGLKLDNSIF